MSRSICVVLETDAIERKGGGLEMHFESPSFVSPLMVTMRIHAGSLGSALHYGAFHLRVGVYSTRDSHSNHFSWRGAGQEAARGSPLRLRPRPASIAKRRWSGLCFGCAAMTARRASVPQWPFLTVAAASLSNPWPSGAAGNPRADP